MRSAPGRRGNAGTPPIVIRRLGPFEIRRAIRFLCFGAVGIALALMIARPKTIVLAVRMRDADRPLGARAIGSAIGEAAISALERVEARELDLLDRKSTRLNS